MNLSKQILLYILFALSLTNTGCESIFLNEQSTDDTQWIKHTAAAEQCIPYEFETIEDALKGGWSREEIASSASTRE